MELINLYLPDSVSLAGALALILITAIVGVAYARYEGFNTLKSGMSQLMRNEVPIYEIISGATLTFAALLLIIPGFVTDILGFLMILPISRKIIFTKIIKNRNNETNQKNNFIDGEFEDIDDDENDKIR